MIEIGRFTKRMALMCESADQVQSVLKDGIQRAREAFKAYPEARIHWYHAPEHGDIVLEIEGVPTAKAIEIMNKALSQSG